MTADRGGYEMQYNILDYGALADGTTNNQKQIQAAIEDCAKTGGRVVVPPGRFCRGRSGCNPMWSCTWKKEAS